MDTPLFSAETYHAMSTQHIADVEVFAALHSPFTEDIQDTVNPHLTIGMAPLRDKTVWALYTVDASGQAMIVRCWAKYTRLYSAEE